MHLSQLPSGVASLVTPLVQTLFFRIMHSCPFRPYCNCSLLMSLFSSHFISPSEKLQLSSLTVLWSPCYCEGNKAPARLPDAVKWNEASSCYWGHRASRCFLNWAIDQVNAAVVIKWHFVDAAFSPAPFIREQVTEININSTTASLEISFVPWLDSLRARIKRWAQGLLVLSPVNKKMWRI